MLKSFLIWFSICFICYVLRTIYNILNYKQKKYVDSKNALIAIYVVMFILWISWFQMCFSDPIKMSFPLWFRFIGLLCFITGIFFLIFSHVKMKGFGDQGNLVTKGIYSRIRNPMYLGFIIWIIGFPVFLQKLLSLSSSIIWIAHIIVWKILEERELEKKYPEYLEYKKRTWF